MHRLCTLLFLACCALTSTPSAEIVWARVSWNPVHCGISSQKPMERRLSDIEAVCRVSMDYDEGVAQLSWKPNKVYDDRAVRTAVAWVGLAIKDVHLKVRGTISHDAKNVYLTSLGDGTKLPLVSAPKAAQGLLITKGSLSTPELDADVRRRLLAAEDSHQIVTIEGPVFMPYRPPVRLQIDRISLSD